MASLRRNFSVMVTGRAIYAAAQWLLIIVLAQLSTPDTLGHFTYALAVTGPIIVFSQLNMRAYMATDTLELFTFRDYLYTRLASIIAALVAMGAIAFSTDVPGTAALLIILVGLYKAIEAVSDVFYGVMQKHELMTPIARSVALRGLIALFAMTAAILTENSVILGAAIIAIAWLAVLLLHDIPKANKLLVTNKITHRPRVWKVASTCFPMGVVLTLMSLRINIPVYFIRNQLGSESVGYYSAVAYFLVAGALVSGSLAQASSPRLARLLQSGNKRGFLVLLYKLLIISSLVGVGGVVFAYIFGDTILRLFYGSNYAQLKDLLVIIMLAAAVNYLSQLLGMSLTVARLLWFQLFSNGIAALVVFMLAYFLVPSQGLVGGGIALLCGVSAALICNASALVVKLQRVASVKDRNSGT